MTDARPPQDKSVFLVYLRPEQGDDLRKLSFEIPTNGVEKLLFVYDEKVEWVQSPYCVWIQVIYNGRRTVLSKLPTNS